MEMDPRQSSQLGLGQLLTAPCPFLSQEEDLMQASPKRTAQDLIMTRMHATPEASDGGFSGMGQGLPGGLAGAFHMTPPSSHLSGGGGGGRSGKGGKRSGTPQTQGTPQRQNSDYSDMNTKVSGRQEVLTNIPRQSIRLANADHIPSRQ